MLVLHSATSRSGIYITAVPVPTNITCFAGWVINIILFKVTADKVEVMKASEYHLLQVFGGRGAGGCCFKY